MEKVNSDIISGLKEYFNSHTEEEVLADFEKLRKWHKVGPTMEEFEKAQLDCFVPYQLCPKCGGNGKILNHYQRFGEDGMEE